MPSLHRPSNVDLARCVERARRAPLSDPAGRLEIIEAASPAKAGAPRWKDADGTWFVDRYSEVVGRGEVDFAAACDALRDWAMFRQPWTCPALPPAAIVTDATVGYAARVLGLWWSYCCRITEVIEDTYRGPDGGSEHWVGFHYATVRGHAERGEERFLVVHDSATDEVRFELFAVSRPGRWFTWIGMPLARRAQSRFRPGAGAAMRQWVSQRANGASSAGG